MNKAYLLTGGNLGNRLNNLIDARKLIEQYCGKIAQRSSVYKTAAWGFTDQPDFYQPGIGNKNRTFPRNTYAKTFNDRNTNGKKKR